MRRAWLALRRVVGLAGRDPPATLGLAILLGFIALTALHPLLAPFGPTALRTGPPLAGPSLGHPFGTDGAGMDVFSRVLYGTRYAVGMTLAAVLVALAAGVPLGLWGGLAGGRLDRAMLWLFNTLGVVPPMVLALATAAAVGASPWHIVLVLGLLEAPAFARMVRAEVLALRRSGFIEGAVAAGNPLPRLLLVHLLPVTLRGAPGQAALRGAWMLRIVALLGFLGLGFAPVAPEWGTMIAQGAEDMVNGKWWVGVFPGLALILFGFSLQLTGNGLVDLLAARRREPG